MSGSPTTTWPLKNAHGSSSFLIAPREAGTDQSRDVDGHPRVRIRKRRQDNDGLAHCKGGAEANARPCAERRESEMGDPFPRAGQEAFRLAPQTLTTMNDQRRDQHRGAGGNSRKLSLTRARVQMSRSRAASSGDAPPRTVSISASTLAREERGLTAPKNRREMRVIRQVAYCSRRHFPNVARCDPKRRR